MTVRTLIEALHQRIGRSCGGETKSSSVQRRCTRGIGSEKHLLLFGYDALQSDLTFGSVPTDKPWRLAIRYGNDGKLFAQHANIVPVH